jgi:hypothetical protein
MFFGRVLAVTDDIFTAEFADEEGVPLVGEFYRNTLLPYTDVVVGDVVEITPTNVHVVDTGVWTQEEVDRIDAEARTRFAQFNSSLG